MSAMRVSNRQIVLYECYATSNYAEMCLRGGMVNFTADCWNLTPAVAREIAAGLARWADEQEKSNDD